MIYKAGCLCCICFAWTAAAAQNRIYRINADTIHILSACDTAELILENRTREILNGVLTNKGNGVTEFRKVLSRLNDSLYLVGGDTLRAAAFGKNIYNADGIVTGDRIIDGNGRNLQFANSHNLLLANRASPVIISRTPIDSSLIDQLTNAASSPFAGLRVRGTGCDASLELVSDSVGTCNQGQMIDFTTLRPRKDSWLTGLPDSYGDKYLLGRIQLQTNNQVPDYASISFSVKSDTAFFHDGAFTLRPAGFVNGYMNSPVLVINPSFRHPTQGYHTKMPYVQVNGGLFVGYGRNWYYNSRNANDIIPGVDDVAGYLQPFFETRFSVYADSMPLKIYKLPSAKGSAFLTYTPSRTVEGNNVAFEYKDSIYEDIRQYISSAGLVTPSDGTLKENIMPSILNAGRLLTLPIMSFNYKADKDKRRYTGLIAQDLLPIAPELVSGTEGSYSIDYVKMVPYLLKVLQEQQVEINELRVARIPQKGEQDK